MGETVVEYVADGIAVRQVSSSDATFIMRLRVVLMSTQQLLGRISACLCGSHVQW